MQCLREVDTQDTSKVHVSAGLTSLLFLGSVGLELSVQVVNMLLVLLLGLWSLELEGRCQQVTLDGELLPFNVNVLDELESFHLRYE
jgi:hypothetical protein